MVKGWQVKPHRQDPVTAGLSLCAARAEDRSRSWSLGTAVPGPTWLSVPDMTEALSQPES
jgi:hypothetical protein